MVLSAVLAVAWVKDATLREELVGTPCDSAEAVFGRGERGCVEQPRWWI